jgi:putative FmdB family regulatory protein
MPTYVYRCNECGHEFEEYQSIVDKPLDTCPVCKGKVERIISGGAGFLFKGSGFYITDHRSESYRKSAAADTGGATASSSSSNSTAGSSSDSKSTKASDKKKSSSD